MPCGAPIGAAKRYGPWHDRGCRLTPPRGSGLNHGFATEKEGEGHGAARIRNRQRATDVPVRQRIRSGNIRVHLRPFAFFALILPCLRCWHQKIVGPLTAAGKHPPSRLRAWRDRPPDAGSPRHPSAKTRRPRRTAPIVQAGAIAHPTCRRAAMEGPDRMRHQAVGCGIAPHPTLAADCVRHAKQDGHAKNANVHK